MKLSGGVELRNALGILERMITKRGQLFDSVCSMARDAMLLRQQLLATVEGSAAAERIVRRCEANADRTSAMSAKFYAAEADVRRKWPVCKALMGDFLRSGRTQEDLDALLAEFPVFTRELDMEKRLLDLDL